MFGVATPGSHTGNQHLRSLTKANRKGHRGKVGQVRKRKPESPAQQAPPAHSEVQWLLLYWWFERMVYKIKYRGLRTGADYWV